MTAAPTTAPTTAGRHPADGQRGGRLLAAARVVCLAEATSFLLLLVATAIKYAAGHPGGVQVLGPVHGVLFLAYLALVGLVAARGGWRPGRTALALGASVLPVAPYFVERAWLTPRRSGPDRR